MNESPLFVVSPHLDDAVFSAGELLALRPGSTVCTVFAGKPAVRLATSWDQSAGFVHSDEAMQARAREDDRALAMLDAYAIRLSFLDAQYGPPSSTNTLAQEIFAAWERHGRPLFVAPLGLYHSDHIIVADTCCALLARGAPASLLLYEDALYRRIDQVARARRDALVRRGLCLERVYPGRHVQGATKKWRSVRAYRSQLRALGDAHPNDLVEPETYWRLWVDPKAYGLRRGR